MIAVRQALTQADRLPYAVLLLLLLMAPLERTRFPLRLAAGVVVTNVELLLGLTLITWVAARGVQRRLPSLPKGLAGVAGLWLATLLLSAWQAPAYQEEAFRFVGRMAAGMALAWAVYDLCASPSRWRWAGQTMALAGMAVAVLGLGEALQVQPIVTWLAQFKEAPTRVGEIVRVSSTLIYATICSMVLELAAPLAAAWTRGTADRPRWGRSAAWEVFVGFLLVIVVQVLTFTRGGMIALPVALGVAAWLSRSRDRLFARISVAGMVTLAFSVAAISLLNPVARLRFLSETDRAWYRAAYRVPEVIHAAAGDTVTVAVRVRNTGLRTWDPEGPYPFALSYHLLWPDGSVLAYDGLRTPLPRLVPPGDEVVVWARVAAPPQPGEYVVAWDMVQYAVTWFSWKGTPPARTRLVLSGPPVSGRPRDPSPPPEDVRLIVPAPGRLTLWRVAWRMFLERPLLGVGPDNFRLLYGRYLGLSRWDKGIHANNLYLEWLADTGVVGLFAFLAFALSLARAVRRSLASTRVPGLWPYRVALAAALIAWFVHGLVDYFYEFWPTTVPFWAIVGLALREVHRGGGDGSPRI